MCQNSMTAGWESNNLKETNSSSKVNALKNLDAMLERTKMLWLKSDRPPIKLVEFSNNQINKFNKNFKLHQKPLQKLFKKNQKLGSKVFWTFSLKISIATMDALEELLKDLDQIPTQE